MSAIFAIEDGHLVVGDRRFPAEVDVSDMARPTVMQVFSRGADPVGFRERRARLQFESGYVLSVVFGTATYSSNRDAYGDDFTETPATVEIACWNDRAELKETILGKVTPLISFEGWNDGNVLGWCTPAYMLAGIEALADGWLPVDGDPWPMAQESAA